MSQSYAGSCGFNDQTDLGAHDIHIVFESGAGGISLSKVNMSDGSPISAFLSASIRQNDFLKDNVLHDIDGLEEKFSVNLDNSATYFSSDDFSKFVHHTLDKSFDDSMRVYNALAEHLEGFHVMEKPGSTYPIETVENQNTIQSFSDVLIRSLESAIAATREYGAASEEEMNNAERVLEELKTNASIADVYIEAYNTATGLGMSSTINFDEFKSCPDTSANDGGAGLAMGAAQKM